MSDFYQACLHRARSGTRPGLFLFLALPENATFLRLNRVAGALLYSARTMYPIGMEQLLEQLKDLGFTESECEAVKAAFAQDEDISTLEEYVLLMRLHYDDRHEFVD